MGYRWKRGDVEVADLLRLRTPRGSDLLPGETQLVPVHIVPPTEPGRYELELDVIHEGERWFGCGVSFSVDVRSRQRIAVVGAPATITGLVADLRLPPSVEVVPVLRDASDRELYGDYVAVDGFRSYRLAGTETKSRGATIGVLAGRTVKVTRAARRNGRAEPSVELTLDAIAETDGLVIAGPSWGADAAQGREWWAVAATALAWRLGGRSVAVRPEALPGGTRLRDRALRLALRTLATDAGASRGGQPATAPHSEDR